MARQLAQMDEDDAADRPPPPPPPPGSEPAGPAGPSQSPQPPRPVRGGPPPRPPGRGPERPRRPAPVPPPARQGVESTPRDRDPLRPIELPTRAIQQGGEEWVVRESGRTSAGVGRDTRAPLLHLIFARAGEPERPLRECLAPGRGIADLTDDELADLLARARPYQEHHDRQEVFPDTRKKGGKGM